MSVKINWNDKQQVLTAVKNDFNEFFFASDELKNNKNFVLSAMSFNANIFIYISENLQNDKEIVLTAVSKNGELIKHASEKLRCNRNIVLTAINQNCDAKHSIGYHFDNFKNDNEIILSLVKQKGKFLSYASENLQNDKNIVLTAIKENPMALIYASEQLQNDIDCLKILKNCNTIKEQENDVQEWYYNRMKIFNILEQQEWLEENSAISNISIKKIKF